MQKKVEIMKKNFELIHKSWYMYIILLIGKCVNSSKTFLNKKFT